LGTRRGYDPQHAPVAQPESGGLAWIGEQSDLLPTTLGTYLSVWDLHPPRGRMRIARRAHQERHGGPALGAAPRLPGGDAERPARRGRGASGLPRPLGLALFVREFDQEVRAPFPPPVVVRATLAPLAWLASRRGRGAGYAGRPATA